MLETVFAPDMEKGADTTVCPFSICDCQIIDAFISARKATLSVARSAARFLCCI
jgi:hypothetical protein